MNEYKGQCLCGSCQYVVRGQKPAAMYLCHCSRCRKETGTIYGANVFFSDAELVWLLGKDNSTHFKLENTRKERMFCKTCGSPLPRKEGESSVVLPAGTLEGGADLTPTAHIFYESRASWEDDVGKAKRFNGLPCSN